jgi:Tfp pilus assembly protein PilO
MSIRMKSFLQVMLVYGILLVLIVINYPLIEKQYSAGLTRLDGTKANVADLTSKIENLHTEIANIEQENSKLLAEKPDLEKKISELKNRLLTEKDFPSFLKNLQDICLQNKIEIVNLEQTVAREFTGKYYRSTFLLNAKGTYSDLAKLLGMTESFTYLLTIKDFFILNVDVKTGILNVRLNMMIYLRENKA